MSKVRPLDPSRWTFSAPKESSRDIPDPPGFSLLNRKEDSAVVNKPGASNRGILEKVL